MSNQPLLTAAEVRASLKPQLVDLWDAACLCLDLPHSGESLNSFRSKCRPADIVLLLRVAAENNREERQTPFRVL
jgi:hypothetical protein